MSMLGRPFQEAKKINWADNESKKISTKLYPI